MGSSPSQVQLPDNMEVISRSSAPSTSRRKGGFKEVEISDPGSNRPSTGGDLKNNRNSDNRNKENRNNNNNNNNNNSNSNSSNTRPKSAKWQQQVDEVTDGQDYTNLLGHQSTANSNQNNNVNNKNNNSSKPEENSTTYKNPSIPRYENTGDDDLVMETFYHSSGAAYSCIYQAGHRFFLDTWDTMDWQPFPNEWYSDGLLVTNDPSYNQTTGSGDTDDNKKKSGASTGIPGMGDDREGFIDHPDRGKISTYLFEEPRNVHYWYDETSGSWIKLPISWELKSEIVNKLLEPIQEAIPEWNDKHDMLSALRMSNYDPHDTISTYYAAAEAGNVLAAKSKEDDKLLKEKEEKLVEMTGKFKKFKKKCDKLKNQVDEYEKEKKNNEEIMNEMREKLSMLEADNSSKTAQLESLQTQLSKRPKSSVVPSSPAKRSVATPPPPIINIDPKLANNMKKLISVLHKEQIQLKMESQRKFDDLQKMFKTALISTLKLNEFDSGLAQEMEEVKKLYRSECLQRKLLFNKLQELRGNIRVFCRCRDDSRVDCALNFQSDNHIVMPDNKSFQFDRVFAQNTQQEEVFEESKPIITSCIDGYSVCIIAYGQTGSGKTYTMMGPDSNPGVNIRAVEELLKLCKDRTNIEYTLRASMMEIYNETIHDLLNDDLPTLEIRAKGNKIQIPNLSEMMVQSMDDIKEIMRLGNKNRSVASTKMNSQSSRSHLIFQLHVEGKDKTSNSISSGQLTLCDLAGSERVSKTEATGQRLIEAASINKSLTSLGQVFTALRNGQLHIPYRNSKLTHILQPCLGGDAKACLFITVSPDGGNLQETGSTLTFGENARQVALGEAKRNVKKAPNLQNKAPSGNIPGPGTSGGGIRKK